MIVALALAVAMLRVVSLAPALTEDLFAIGAGSDVIAVDAYSNRPSRAAHLPRVGSLREANAEAILALHPDLVVGIPYEAPALTALGHAGVRVVSLPLDDLAEDFTAIERLGALTGHARAAHALHERIARELGEIALGAAAAPVRSAFVVLSTAPIFTAGPDSYIGELLRLAHLRNVVPKTGTAWPEYSAERLVIDQPQIIVEPSPGMALSGAPWDRLRAVRDGHILTVPEDDLLHPGPYVANVLRTIVHESARWR